MAFSLLTLALLEAVGASSAFGLVLVQLNTDLCELGYFLCSPSTRDSKERGSAPPWLFNNSGEQHVHVNPSPKTAQGNDAAKVKFQRETGSAWQEQGKQGRE